MNKALQGEALINKAAILAEELHAGQEHFFGEGSYYEMHLAPVATIVRRLGYGALYISAAYLHDSMEDTPVTGKELRGEGIPTEVIHAVDLMAKKDGQAHEEYLEGIISDPISTVGKYADSSFNYSWTILNSPALSDDNFRDWGLEYAYNIAVLRPQLPEIK